MEVSTITRLITPLGIVVIMFGMGLSLTLDDFKRVWVRPKPILIGIVLQIVGLPILGFAFASALELKPMLAVGVMLLSACPGGAITNLVSFISKGDAALSVSLTCINSFITILTIPLVTTFSLGYFLGQEAAEKVNVTLLSIGIIAITVPPITMGMFMKAKAPLLAQKAENWVRPGTIVFIVFLVCFACYNEKQIFLESYKEFSALAVNLCLLSALMGAVVGGLFRLPKRQVLTLAIEVGLHNSAMAIVIALSFIGIQALAVFSAFYLIVEYIVSGGVMLITNIRFPTHGKIRT